MLKIKANAMFKSGGPGYASIYAMFNPMNLVMAEAERRGWNQSELARKLDVLPQHVRNWNERGLPASRYTQVATLFGWSLDRLAGKANEGNTSDGPEIKGQVPLISWVQAGDFAGIVDNFSAGHADEWVETTVPIHKHTYALRVSGDSMTDPSGHEPTFPHGSKIVVEPDFIDSVDRMVNKLVIVRSDGDQEATFKRLVRDSGRYYLKPINPQYPMLPLPEDAVFCGVVREKVVRYD